MKRDNISIIKKKLRSMRYSKKDVQSETSRDAKQFMYGYTECINDLLEYLTSGKDGLPEHDLLADEPAGQVTEEEPKHKTSWRDFTMTDEIEDYPIYSKEHNMEIISKMANQDALLEDMELDKEHEKPLI